MTAIRYVNTPNCFLVRKKGQTSESSGSTQLLIGARLHIDETTIQSGWVKAKTVPNEKGEISEGFIELGKCSETQQLKIFYVDVGQGDATLIESEGSIVIIDGGPNRGFYDELIKRLKSLQRADKAIGKQPQTTMHISAIIVSHFDLDHYQGLTKIVASNKFTIGKIYHNGLPRYGEPADKDLDLGSVTKHLDGSYSISSDLTDIDSARALLASGLLLTKAGGQNKFAKFLTAVVQAKDDNRLEAMEPIIRRHLDGLPPTIEGTGDLRFEILAPVSTQTGGSIRLPAFPNPHDISANNPHPSPSSSHTINGNSVVLKLTYGDNSFLFGGDLNQPAQVYLNQRYQNTDIFQVDVNKACHHGSSDFELGYLQAVSPHATVFSSGDNGSHDHPLPDAMGAAAKHSQGDFPLVFSTELARETSFTQSKKIKKIKYGHINARSNGNVIVIAQKKEKPSLKKTWHSFQLPHAGPFGHQG